MKKSELMKQLRESSLKELEKKAQALRKEIARLRLEFSVNPPKDTNLLIKKRKELARVLTVIKEKQLLENND